MQPVDYTTLLASCYELRSAWLPARLEQVYQRDRFTIALALRTLSRRGWLTLSWHPQAARICLGEPPPRLPDTFTFSQQLQHQLRGLALIALEAIAPWERVLDLQFARRPGEPAVWHLYVEIMAKYSNVILVGQDQLIITAAHQVSPQQSSVRPIQTGQLYETPPTQTKAVPSLEEPQERWQERLCLISGPLQRMLLHCYCGLSPALAQSMVDMANCRPDQLTDSLTATDWVRLFHFWRKWLEAIEQLSAGTQDTDLPKPGLRPRGYSVLGWGVIKPVASVQALLNHYYTNQLNQQAFQQLRQQLCQKLSHLLGKLRQKLRTFQDRLQQSEAAEQYRQQADLLMAYPHQWQPGLQAIALPDFESNQPVTISLDPEKNAIQNAQALYRRHQKLKRARTAVAPLIQVTQEEVHYLEQIEATLAQFEEYSTPEDLWALEEIRDELMLQGYLDNRNQRQQRQTKLEHQQQTASHPYRYRTPGGYEVLVGRNNRQNDQLTFRIASDYDLWFHTQEIPGSHVLLRLNPGAVPGEKDLQCAADLAALYSRGRNSQQVPVVFTEPRYVFKPKGAKPGFTVYRQEQILWGNPQRARQHQAKLVEEDQ